ncbi:MAG: hypothetical protein WBC91_15685 [Phototrophicaceae bacterium]
MSDFDDFRDMFDDDDDDEYSDISFDDIVDEDLDYGQEIGYTDEFDVIDEPVEAGPVNQFVNSMTPQQRLIISAMLFGNVLILAIGLLIATGRLG